jgi:diphosphomevalonate decarboxylase
MKATAKANSDIALVKYWGKKNEALRLPQNGSISIVLDGLNTITTVEFDDKLQNDDIEIEGQKLNSEADRVSKHLDRIRELAGSNLHAKVISQNSFPKGTGLSSSGSGFAALTYAAIKAIGLKLSDKDISILARQGSGTACRCVMGGFVEWKDGDISDTSFSHTIFDQNHFDVRDVIVVVDEGMKKVSSTKGHTKAHTSIAFGERQKRIGIKIEKVKKLIKDRDFQALGEIIEAESLEFHSILLTSTPPMIAWYPGTIQVMHEVQSMRQDGLLAFFTINTGFNVHVLTLPKFEKDVHARLKKLSLVKNTLLSKVGGKPQYLDSHLF